MDAKPLSARLFELAHLGRVVAKLDYGIEGKLSKPTGDDWTAGLSSDPQRNNGSWAALIQESNEVMPLYLATINRAYDDLPNAPELPRYDHNGEPWKPVCHRLLSKLAVSDNVQAFVEWFRLPNEWDSWLREIDEIATVLESYEATEAMTAQAAEPAKPNAKPSGMTWPEAQVQLERIKATGKAFTSQREMAERIGCGPSTVTKAIENGGADLQDWASKKRGAASRKVVATIDGAIGDATPQNREADPADILDDDDVDKAMRALMEQAEPNERARINAMSPADRRALAELAFSDPDAEEQIMGSERRR